MAERKKNSSGGERRKSQFREGDSGGDFRWKSKKEEKIVEEELSDTSLFEYPASNSSSESSGIPTAAGALVDGRRKRSTEADRRRQGRAEYINPVGVEQLKKSIRTDVWALQKLIAEHAGSRDQLVLKDIRIPDQEEKPGSSSNNPNGTAHSKKPVKNQLFVEYGTVNVTIKSPTKRPPQNKPRSMGFTFMHDDLKDAPQNRESIASERKDAAGKLQRLSRSPLQALVQIPTSGDTNSLTATLPPTLSSSPKVPLHFLSPPPSSAGSSEPSSSRGPQQRQQPNAQIYTFRFVSPNGAPDDEREQQYLGIRNFEKLPKLQFERILPLNPGKITPHPWIQKRKEASTSEGQAQETSTPYSGRPKNGEDRHIHHYYYYYPSPPQPPQHPNYSSVGASYNNGGRNNTANATYYQPQPVAACIPSTCTSNYPQRSPPSAVEHQQYVTHLPGRTTQAEQLLPPHVTPSTPYRKYRQGPPPPPN